MGLGSYDEDEHQRREKQNEVKDGEYERADRQEGDLKFEYEGFEGSDDEKESDIVDEMLNQLNTN